MTAWYPPRRTPSRQSRRRHGRQRSSLRGRTLLIVALLAGLAWVAPGLVARWHQARSRATAAAPSPPAGYDWTTYGATPGNSFTAASGTLAAATAANLKLAWETPADAEVSGDPVAWGDRVFFGSRKGTAYAVSRRTGAVLWRRSLDGTGIDGGALVDAGRLFFATSGGRVFCLDPRTGATLWESASLLDGLKDALRASPKAYGGIVYEDLGGDDDDLHEQGGVVALNERTGAILWRTLLVHYAGGGAVVFSPPAIVPQLGELVVATGNPTPFPTNGGPADGIGPVPAGNDPDSDSLVALSLQSGRVLWTQQTHAHDADDRDFIAAPNVVPLAGGRLAVGAGEKDGAYYLFDAASGQPIWKTDLTQAQSGETLIVATAATAGGRIFVGTMDIPTGSAWPGNYQSPAVGRLVALDAATGQVDWTDVLPSAVAAAPVAAAGAQLAVEANGVLFAASPATGQVTWQAQTPGHIRNAEAALSLAGPAVLVPLSAPGGLAAYSPAS